MALLTANKAAEWVCLTEDCPSHIYNKTTGAIANRTLVRNVDGHCSWCGSTRLKHRNDWSQPQGR